MIGVKHIGNELIIIAILSNFFTFWILFYFIIRIIISLSYWILIIIQSITQTLPKRTVLIWITQLKFYILFKLVKLFNGNTKIGKINNNVFIICSLRIIIKMTWLVINSCHKHDVREKYCSDKMSPNINCFIMKHKQTFE